MRNDHPRSVLSRLRTQFALSTLRENFAWTAIGNAFYLATQWAMLTVLAKASSPELVGRFSFALALTAPVVATSTMGLRQVLVTDAKQQYRYGDYLTLRLTTSLAAAVVILGVVLGECHTTELRATGLLVGAAKLCESISDIVHGRLQRAERMNVVALSLIIKGTASLALLGVLFITTRSLVWATAGLATAALGVLLLYDLPASRRAETPESLRLRWSFGTMRTLAATAAPIMVGILLTSSAGALPRYFLEAARGHREVGYYAAASAPLMVMAFLPGVLTQATLARAARYYQEGEHSAFLRLNSRVMLVMVIVNLGFVAGALLFGDVVLRVLFTREYSHLRGTMVVFTLSQTVAAAATIGSQLMASARMFRLQLVNAVTALVALVVASRYLVPAFGVTGSAWAEVIRNTAATMIPLALTILYVRRRGMFKTVT